MQERPKGLWKLTHTIKIIEFLTDAEREGGSAVSRALDALDVSSLPGNPDALGPVFTVHHQFVDPVDYSTPPAH